MTVGEPTIPLYWVRPYVSPRQRRLTGIEEQDRETAIGLKTGEKSAFDRAGPAMAQVILEHGGADILIPIPSSKRGVSMANLRLAQRIANALPAPVAVERMVGRAHEVESSMERRRRGELGLSRAEHAASMATINPGAPRAWLVDNVITSGNTMYGAWDVLGRPPNMRGIAWAKAEETVMPQLVDNPAWLARVVTERMDDLKAAVPAEWLPELGKLKATGRGNKVVGELEQYGCGAYGCVLPTSDPHVVLKVTQDDTEVDLVRQILPKVCPPGITNYYVTLDLGNAGRHPVFALWREAANGIGAVSAEAALLLQKTHKLSDAAYAMLTAAPDPYELYTAALERAKHAHSLTRLFDGMVKNWKVMAADDELGHVGSALLAFLDAGVLIADIHDGNVGHVERDGSDMVVITDPGHAMVLPAPWR